MSDAEDFSRQWARERDAAMARTAPPPGTRAATQAETASLNAAVAEGYRVVGVAETTEVPAADGRVRLQVVVVNVARGDGPVTAWPCTWHPRTGRVST